MKVKEKPVSKKLKIAVKNKVSVKKSNVSPKKIVKKKNKLESMTTDDFFDGGFEDVDENSGSSEEVTKKTKSKKLKKRKAENSVDIEGDSDLDDDDNVQSHKKDLENLKEVDPEFYQFLQENDKELLDFDDISDDENSDEDKIHVPPEKLEVASDESDFEPEDNDNARDSNVVTLKTIDKWRENLQKDKSSKTLREVLEAFQAALQCVVAENERMPCKYQVEGSAVFNGVLRLCVMEVQPALRLILKMPSGSKSLPTKSKSWPKVRVILRDYLLNLTRLCQVTSPGMLSVLLKHVHQMAPYAVLYSNIVSKFLTRLVSLWTSDDDVVRVLSFLCLLRIANIRRALLGHILKKMYLAFVRNSKFVSPTSLPGINFMRQSLAEMFALDPVLSYQHAFLYIRQLSIHLRNAVTLNKKESFQAVYNWQYIQSLQLWSELLGLVSQESPLGNLLYPLVQITLGTIKLIPSAQYYPLRFHCCKFLLSLIEKRGVFIPVTAFLLEVLKDFDFNRKHTKVSMKPMEFSCILRCSKLQMQENGFKDAVIESVCALLLEAFAIDAHRLSFPDTVVPAVIQMKQFLKVCKVAKYTRQVKAVLEKAMENAKFVEAERNKSTIRLDDAKGIAAIEASIRQKGTPMMTYYQTWLKLHLQQQAKKVTDNESIGDFKLPTLYKFDKKKSREKEKEGPVELFPSDDEDDDSPFLLDNADDSDEETPKKKGKNKPEKKKKKKHKVEEKEERDPKVRIPSDWPEVDAADIVEDLNVSDLD